MTRNRDPRKQRKAKPAKGAASAKPKKAPAGTPVRRSRRRNVNSLFASVQSPFVRKIRDNLGKNELNSVTPSPVSSVKAAEPVATATAVEVTPIPPTTSELPLSQEEPDVVEIPKPAAKPLVRLGIGRLGGVKGRIARIRLAPSLVDSYIFSSRTDIGSIFPPVVEDIAREISIAPP